MSKESDDSRGGSIPSRYFYQIICFLRKEHDFRNKTIIIDENVTENQCKCGMRIQMDWSNAGGYKRAMSAIDELVRKRRWDES